MRKSVPRIAGFILLSVAFALAAGSCIVPVGGIIARSSTSKIDVEIEWKVAPLEDGFPYIEVETPPPGHVGGYTKNGSLDVSRDFLENNILKFSIVNHEDFDDIKWSIAFSVEDENVDMQGNGNAFSIDIKTYPYGYLSNGRTYDISVVGKKKDSVEMYSSYLHLKILTE